MIPSTSSNRDCIGNGIPSFIVNSEKDTSLKRFPEFTLPTIYSGVTMYRSISVCLYVR